MRRERAYPSVSTRAGSHSQQNFSSSCQLGKKAFGLKTTSKQHSLASSPRLNKPALIINKKSRVDWPSDVAAFGAKRAALRIFFSESEASRVDSRDRALQEESVRVARQRVLDSCNNARADNTHNRDCCE